MAAHLSPPPLVYEPEHSDPTDPYYYAAAEVYQPQHQQLPSYCYPHQQREVSASSYPGAQDHASAITIVSSNQDPTPHQLYGDATAAVIPYPVAFSGDAGVVWAQPKPAHTQNFYLAGARREAVYYDSGGASPVSDDSNPAFYDSPASSEASNLADDRRSCSHPSADQGYYGRSVPTPPSEAYVQQEAYSLSREAIHDSTVYESVTGQYRAASQPRYDYSQEYSQNYPAAYYPEHSPVEEGFRGSQVYPNGVSHAEYSELSSPTCYADPYRQSLPASNPGRTESPMAHLPYQDMDIQSRNAAQSVTSGLYSANSSPYATVPQLPMVMPVPHQQPHYPPQQATQPTPIAIPSRSPPLIEDTPKKPLTLACFFCRKRKIACGTPPPGAKDRTCNQCARRKLQCVYPAGTRRSARQREGDTTGTAAATQSLRANA